MKGVWHVVMNMTTTVAVTHNFCSLTNFPAVWSETVRNRPKLSEVWLENLKKKRPEVWQMAQKVEVPPLTDSET